VALHVCRRRTAGPVASLGAPRRDRACVLEAERRRRSNVADMATVCHTFFGRTAPQDDSEFFVHACLHLRSLGRNSVRSRGSDGAGRSGREDRTSGSAARFAGDHACFFRHHSRMPRDALARGKICKTWSVGLLLRPDARLHCPHIWQNLLSRTISPYLVLAARILRFIRCGCPSNIQPSAARAPLLFQRLLRDLAERGSPSLSARAFSIFNLWELLSR